MVVGRGEAVRRLPFRAADFGSIRQAAEALLMKQSIISRSIRQLEDTLGLAVFARTSGGVQATDAGRQFLRMARSMLVPRHRGFDRLIRVQQDR
ncbi:LysR family transcriptional regulator [Bradyrhizobium sp. SZCCHNS1054]|uniref:LysR family transcriptional regulator n=1 Tax=Bradyrhizobium sp. SZCCHNS1054 TaxID=3057301 RepID=UPI002915D681|nr:LysR family transcriptional regulator [Bradyrhizobium sp. SZCCHNS1054]